MKKKEYIVANKAWLTAKSREAGVKALTKGIYYKVLTEAKAGAKQPNARSIITVHYTGYTIDGQCFDSSREGVAPAFRLSELIEGWIIAADARGRALGALPTCRAGLWQVRPARHPRGIDPHLRYRAP